MFLFAPSSRPSLNIDNNSINNISINRQHVHHITNAKSTDSNHNIVTTTFDIPDHNADHHATTALPSLRRSTLPNITTPTSPSTNTTAASNEADGISAKNSISIVTTAAVADILQRPSKSRSQASHRQSLPSIHTQYDYLRSLIARPRLSGRIKPSADTTALCVTLPESVLAKSSPSGVAGQEAENYTVLPSPSSTAGADEIMATVYEVDERLDADDSVPGSPPDLAYSKSSKSSSSLTSDDDVSEAALSIKTGNFDDVSLEHLAVDIVDDSNLPPNDRPTLRRPQRKVSSPGGERRPSQSPSMGAFPNGSQSRFPSLHGAVHSVLQDQSLNLPHGSRLMRSSTSPVSPYGRSYPHQFSSRSPSPNHRNLGGRTTFSPPASSGATPKASIESARPGSFGRRMSWQPGRKTVKELEAECNDDDDDEVPDGAILENVPMTPMPGQSMYLQSPNSSTVRSTTPSPQRRPSYANLHSANIPKNARRPSAPPTTHPHSRSPRSPLNARPPFLHSKTVSAYSGEISLPKHRSKSWTQDLNSEARRLSQALEAYAEQSSKDRRHSGSKSMPGSAAGSPPRPGSSRRSSSKTSISDLPTVPPIQTGNIMIDPLPISKEKEAVLTRTRPSWLPPKSKKEEKRHLKEFQQMMARAAEAEKKRAAKEEEARETRQELQGSIARIWEQHVLPNWDAVIAEPRTRELWWRGVTPSSRGEVWQKAIGNELQLSSTSYEAALARAIALEKQINAMPIEERTNSKEAAWFDAIARDVPAAYPEQQVFKPKGRLHQVLTNVLKAYAMYRSDVGYVYGTHLIAGLVVLNQPEPAEAFLLLSNILNRPLPLAFLVHDTLAMSHAHTLVLSTLKYKFPTLHAHLTAPSLDLHPDEYLDPLFRCLFAYHLPVEIVGRIWDVFAFEGDRALIRAAVAVLGRLESRLYGSKEEVLDLISWRCETKWDLGDEETFVKAMREAGKVEDQ